MKYFVHDKGKTSGPHELSAIVESVMQGGYSTSVLLCPIGDQEWYPLAEILRRLEPTVEPVETYPQESEPRSAPSAPSKPMENTKALLGEIANLISSVSGVERIEKHTSKGMFAEVWKKRTPEEVEAYFSVGSPTTTPHLKDIATTWPRPWAFFKAFIGSVLAFAGLYFMGEYFENPKAIPAILMVGAFAVPGSVLVLFFELNVARNFSIYQLLRLTLLGGILSLVTCLFFFGWASGLGLDWMGASVAGIVEEPAKFLAMLIVVNNPKYRWTLNGLLIGACVGTGFAVVETAGYAFEALFHDMQNGSSVTEQTLFIRALLYPLGGHALLSAITGAALWRVKGDQRFDWEMLKDARFIRLFAVAVVLHAFWNAPFELPFLGKYLLIGFVAWLTILNLVQAGLKEIASAQHEVDKAAVAPVSSP